MLPNGVDYCGSTPSYNRAINKVLKKRFLFFGRIHESKGIREIVKAIHDMEYKDRVSLVVCGDGPDKKWFCDELETVLGDSFIYKGVVKGVGKWTVFSDADYFLLPSRYEGLPMALLETMSSGVVPIVSDIPALSSVVDELCGYTVKAGDSASLKERLDLIVCNPNQDDSKSELCKRIVEENFSCSSMRERLCTIYENISRE